ncbi:hypothetical protein D3C81_580070 [compost metagenome]
MQRAGVRRHGVGGLGGSGLGQVGQAIGEVVDTGIAAGTLGVLQPVIEQRTERLVTWLRLTGLSIVDQVRQGIDGRLSVFTGCLRSRMRRGRAFGLGALFERQAQGRQVGQRIGVRVERFGLCHFLGQALQGRGLQHGSDRFGLRLNQLRARLRVADLPRHQSGIKAAGVIA